MNDKVVRPTHVEPRDGHRIWIRYADGVKGEVDLSDLVGQGVFRAWDEPGVFAGVHVAPHGSIAWNDELEICPDALYLELSGELPGKGTARTRPEPANAGDQ